jgi:hypothetical protein
MKCRYVGGKYMHFMTFNNRSPTTSDTWYLTIHRCEQHDSSDVGGRGQTGGRRIGVVATSSNRLGSQ